MDPQGAPEVLKWSPRMSKWRHQAPQMATPRNQKGPAAEGVALKIILRFSRTKCIETTVAMQIFDNSAPDFSEKKKRTTHVRYNVIPIFNKFAN